MREIDKLSKDVFKYVEELGEDMGILFDRLSIIVTNAEIAPDPRMEGATDCYLVSLDDIQEAEEILKLMLLKWQEKSKKL